MPLLEWSQSQAHRWGSNKQAFVDPVTLSSPFAILERNYAYRGDLGRESVSHQHIAYVLYMILYRSCVCQHINHKNKSHLGIMKKK